MAEELTAQTFYKAAAYRHRIRGDAGRIQLWLLRTATNLANTHYRRRRLRRRLFERFARTRAVATESDDDAETADAQRRDRIRNVLRALGPKYQTVVVLRYYMEMSYDDIAGILGCRENTVRVRLSRALKEMRQRLGVQGERQRPDS